LFALADDEYDAGTPFRAEAGLVCGNLIPAERERRRTETSGFVGLDITLCTRFEINDVDHGRHNSGARDVTHMALNRGIVLPVERQCHYKTDSKQGGQ
jgi:hypothetical protein